MLATPWRLQTDVAMLERRLAEQGHVVVEEVPNSWSKEGRQWGGQKWNDVLHRSDLYMCLCCVCEKVKGSLRRTIILYYVVWV